MKALNKLFTKKEKEQTFTRSEVVAILEMVLDRVSDSNIDWNEIEYSVDIDWDKRIYITDVDASYQVEELLNEISDAFETSLDEFIEMEKENNRRK